LFARRSVECLPNESSLSEDAKIAISSNRCTPATVEINSPSHNVVTSVENIYTAKDILQMPTDCNNLDNIEIIIEDGTEAPIVLHPEYESSNAEDIGENRNLYLKDDRKIPSILQKQAEDNLENMELGSDSNLHTTMDISDPNNQEIEITSNKLVDLNELKLPPILKKRGRPSGSDRTVIGLSSKRMKKCSTIPFNKIKNTDSANIVLKWIVTKYKNVFKKKMLDIKILEDV
jgi:hypothetical protein